MIGAAMVSLRRRQVIIGGLAAAALPAVSFARGEPMPQRGKLVLSGRILDADGKPLAGATVEVGADRAATDGDGRFVLSTRAGEPYRVSFEKYAAEGFVAGARPDLDG